MGVYRYHKGLHVLLYAIERTGRSHPGCAHTRGIAGAHFTDQLRVEDRMALIELSRAVAFPRPIAPKHSA